MSRRLAAAGTAIKTETRIGKREDGIARIAVDEIGSVRRSNRKLHPRSRRKNRRPKRRSRKWLARLDHLNPPPEPLQRLRLPANGRLIVVKSVTGTDADRAAAAVEGVDADSPIRNTRAPVRAAEIGVGNRTITRRSASPNVKPIVKRRRRSSPNPNHLSRLARKCRR